MTKDEALKMALEALNKLTDVFLDTEGNHGDYEQKALNQGHKTILAIKAALAQQDAEAHLQAVSDFGQLQESFGYFKPETFGWTDCAETDEGAMPLYEKPFGMRQPLTYEQINSMWQNTDTGDSELDAREFARAIEAAHDIKEMK